MTSKEKAKELFNKYCYAIRTEENGSGYYTNVIYAKNCALIAVDEILNSNPNYPEFKENEGTPIRYWEVVKQEIENL
jgi:hypothetical protein